MRKIRFRIFIIYIFVVLIQVSGVISMPNSLPNNKFSINNLTNVNTTVDGTISNLEQITIEEQEEKIKYLHILVKSLSHEKKDLETKITNLKECFKENSYEYLIKENIKLKDTISDLEKKNQELLELNTLLENKNIALHHEIDLLRLHGRWLNTRIRNPWCSCFVKMFSCCFSCCSVKKKRNTHKVSDISII